MNGVSSGTDKPSSVKSIEIYATLPKKKNLRSKATAVNVVEDEEYMLYDRPTQRMGLFGRVKRCDEDKKDKKRARSEERNKNVTKDFSIAPIKTNVSPITGKNSKPDKVKENDNHGTKISQTNGTLPAEQKQGKKQHKIRRKLLMGGLIKRKNRSMPDLREGQDGQPAANVEPSSNNTLPKQSVDDSSLGLKGNEVGQSLSGYLSEGHLEFAGTVNTAGSNGNPNLERSRLMRKSFHGSAGKVLHVAKVPPPPPLRTTSQLSKSKCSSVEAGAGGQQEVVGSLYNPGVAICDESIGSTQGKNDAFWGHGNAGNLPSQSGRGGGGNYVDYAMEPHSLQFLPSYNTEQQKLGSNFGNGKPRIQDDVVQYANGILYEPTFVVTRADVHSEQSPVKQQQQQQQQPATTQPDSLPPYPENANNVSHSRQPSEDFPPPPYPCVQSISHSRQPSEDFPPPPPPIEDNLNPGEHQTQNFTHQQQMIEAQQISSLLAQLQLKREQILPGEFADPEKKEHDDDGRNSGETWLRELQAKQAERRMKKQGNSVDQMASHNHDMPKTRAAPTSQNQGSTIARRTSDLMMNSLGQVHEPGRDATDSARLVTVSSSVKDMAARFEQIKQQPVSKTEGENKSGKPTGTSSYTSAETTQDVPSSGEPLKLSSDNLSAFTKSDRQSVLNSSFESSSSQNTFISNVPAVTAAPVNQPESGLNAAILSMSLFLPHENGLPVDCPEDDISEVAMQNTIQNTTILPIDEDIIPRKTKRRIGKKKSVSFCDQVVLVATAEDDEKDSYIPNPILERVLRSALNKPETALVLREIRSLQEAELNRENSAPKFQQKTLPLKSEADSIPATPFQDQLRSVNPVPETIRPTFGRQNSNESGPIEQSQEVKKGYANYVEGQDIVREVYPSGNTTGFSKPPGSYPQQFAQQVRYPQNGHPQYIQGQTTTGYPQTQTAHPRNQGIVPVSQSQKPASPFPTQVHNQYSQQNGNPGMQKVSGFQSNYYQLEQQHNQINKQYANQQQGNINQRIQPHCNVSPVTVSNSPQLANGYPANQSPNPYQQCNNSNNSISSSSSPQSQYPISSYQSYPGQQNRTNQPLPQYQPPPNPAAGGCQQQQMQQQMQQNYQSNNLYQRQGQKNEQQNILAPNQTYPNPLQNGQIQSNMKYPTYQHPPAPKQTKQVHFQVGTKGGQINQNSSTVQKTLSNNCTTVNSRTALCHLCRKKQVIEPAIYCTDCDFYMSRFRPKT